MDDRLNHLDYDTLAAYAVDALPPDDVVTIGEHLRGCAQCQRELASLRAAAGVLPYGLSPSEPPTELRERILQRARATRVGAPVAAGRPSTPVHRPAHRGWWPPRFAPALVAFGLILAFLLGRAFPAVQSSDIAGRPDARAATLSGQASGAFVVAPEAGQAQLSIDGLARLPEGQVYQLWFLGNDGPISWGTLSVDGNGHAELNLSGLAWSATYTGVAITPEPRGGSTTPSGEIIAQGEF